VGDLSKYEDDLDHQIKTRLNWASLAMVVQELLVPEAEDQTTHES
jgi:hypothetical protein